MKRILLAENVMEPSTWEEAEAEDVRAFLMDRYTVLPDTARIYHGQVAEDRDVTPTSEADIERLGELPGPFIVVVYPGDPVTLFIAFVVVTVAAVAAVFLLQPQIPTASLRNTQSTSPNNELSARSNRPRLNGRIPDIFGTVRSTPDLIALPYKIFQNNVELEVAYMCVGRGEYDISDIRDDTTSVSQVNGTSVEVYGPGTSPNSGTPIQTIGPAITAELLLAYRTNSVNGQTMVPPSGASYISTTMKFVYPNKITANSTTTVYYLNSTGGTSSYTVPTDLTAYFKTGDNVTLAVGTFSGGGHTFALSGTYLVTSATTLDLVLDFPGGDWDYLNLLSGSQSAYMSATLTSSATEWVGPFNLDLPEMQKVYLNFVALGGLYKDDGSNQYSASVDLEIELSPINSLGTVIGPAETFTATLEGSATDRDSKAITVVVDPSFTGRARIRARRTTAKDTSFKGNVVDEVKWRDAYAMAPVTQTDFGDVTTIWATTRATAGALAVKDRKLNALVTRKIPLRVSGSTFTSDLHPTNNAAEIFSFICRDVYLGNRPNSEVDYDSIYNAVADVTSYFGTSDAAEFCYTFDNNNLSFEETGAMIAQAVFCRAYRRGSQIKFFFEKKTADSVLLFNHRNKVAGSETRTISFGRSGDYDGVAYEYIDPVDDALVTLYVPQGDASAIRPQKVESAGVRNARQAWFHAWRAWGKIVYNTSTTEYEATQEGDIVIPGQRILVADNTRSDTLDGEVLAQNVLQLTLSQAADIGSGLDPHIHLQLYDGTVDVIPITVDPVNKKLVTLGRAPALSLVVDDDDFARTTYTVMAGTPARPGTFLLTEKDAHSGMTLTMRAVNYDDRYYGNDLDYINGLID